MRSMVDLASGDFFSINTSSMMQGMDIITQLIVYMTIAAMVGGLLFGCIYLLSFKRNIRVYMKTNAGWTHVDTKAREFRTKEGVTKWRFLKWIKFSYPAPSNEMINLDINGKLSAECIREVNGHVTFVKRDLSGNSPTVLSGEAISMTVNELRRAEDYKKKSLGDIVANALPYVVLAMILIIFMVFFNDVVQPSIDYGNQLKASSEQLATASNRLADVMIKVYPDLANSGNSENSGGLRAGDVIPPN